MNFVFLLMQKKSIQKQRSKMMMMIYLIGKLKIMKIVFEKQKSKASIHWWCRLFKSQKQISATSKIKGRNEKTREKTQKVWKNAFKQLQQNVKNVQPIEIESS